MSVKVMGLVWDLELPADQKLVLLALADHADHSGENCRPGIALLARKCSYSERQIQYVIGRLKAAGLIEKIGSERGGRGSVTTYRVLPKRVHNMHPFSDDSNSQAKNSTESSLSVGKGEVDCTLLDSERVQDMHPFPSQKGAQCAPFPRERVQSTTQKGAIHDMVPNKDARVEPSWNHVFSRNVLESESVARARTRGSHTHSQKKKSEKLFQGEEADAVIAELQALEGNRDLSVAAVYGKMLEWCSRNKKPPTRRRLVEWLATEERPLKGETDGRTNTTGEPDASRGTTLRARRTI